MNPSEKAMMPKPKDKAPRNVANREAGFGGRGCRGSPRRDPADDGDDSPLRASSPWRWPSGTRPSSPRDPGADVLPGGTPSGQ
ncbi:hypothetical protein GCM10009849_27310 [Sinomonas flava]|uniref:Uncharacterized protein n=1 Tax=Sinomonas flava TaxID=496857 RepID=A0ABN3BYA6_9MICC